MVFKRPRNSRDDRSGRSSTRTSNTDDRPKRSTSSRGNSSQGSDQTDKNRPERKYSSERSGEKKSYSSPGNKSYQGKSDSFDKPASSFSGGPGEKRSFSARNKPYTGRPADNDDRPKRSFGDSPSGEKKSFTKKKPYSGRFTEGDEKPKRSFGSASTGEKKSFTARGKSSTGSFNSEKPKRSFGAGGEKDSFAPRGKSSTGSFSAEGRPKRSFGGDSAPERKTGSSFRKKEGERDFSTERPERSKPTYDKITRDRDAPVKTLRGRKKAVESKDTGLIRLNRYISNAGICSRRKADELISAGVVSVNGVVISELGHKVDPQKDEIRYNGELLKREKMVYVLLNKPKDYITTTEDPQERRTVMALVEKASKERIYPIGRLDRNTTGLLLMTNDGDLADKLSHPKNNIVKLYQVELNKSLTQGDLNKITYGLELEDGLIKPDSVSYVAGGSKREIGIQIHSGKNRIVRRIFEHLGYEVVKLDRAIYANLTKKDLPRGRWRYLEESEVIQLKHLI